MNCYTTREEHPADGTGRRTPDARYRAIAAKDARFDGLFVTGVTSTRIYCRPSCPATTPKPEHVRFFPTPAAAEAAGFRACKRCRPDAAPDSPDWHWRDDVVARAMHLIQDGVVDRDGVAGLAARLGYSPRQLHRHLVKALGAGPQALARRRRVLQARWLLEATRLPITEVAWAAGFGSVRQFNDAMRRTYGVTPGTLRRRAGPVPDARTDGIPVRLSYRPPLAASALWRFLGERAVPGLEEVTASGAYRRALVLPHGSGVATVAMPTEDAERPLVEAHVVLDDLRDLAVAVEQCRRLFDLNADPNAVAAVLVHDPVLGADVRTMPGRRVPGHPDPFELLIRAIVGQQVSVAAARTLAARLVARYGLPLARPVGGVTRRFPPPEVLASVDPATLGLPRRRAETVVRVAEAVASGAIRLDRGVDRKAVAAALLELPGVGPWTVAYLRMRALHDPDAFPATDLGVRRGLQALGQSGDVRHAERLAEAWRPWRAYAVQYLWARAEGATRPERPAHGSQPAASRTDG